MKQNEKIQIAPEPGAEEFVKRARRLNRMHDAGILLLLLLCLALLIPASFQCLSGISKGENAIRSNLWWLFAAIAVSLLLLSAYIIAMKIAVRAELRMSVYFEIEFGCPRWPYWAVNVPKLLGHSHGVEYVYVYLDIKNFKYINALYGYGLGDDLIRHIGRVLTNNTEKSELFVRVVADKFSLLLTGGTDRELQTRLTKIHDEIQDFQGLNSMINVYFGVYRITDLSMPLSQMSDCALLAMKRVKNCPRDGCYVSFFNEKFRETAVLERALEGEMHAAIGKREFVIYLQPKFNLVLKQAIGAEALVRWQHPTRGLLPPGCFIELFENSGMITYLDRYVFKEVCGMLRRWKEEGRNPLPISVNLSRMALYNSNLPRELYDITQEFGVSTQLILIELTESAALEDAELLTEMLDGLKKYGFTLSIDDFGSGYSSLNILKDMSVDELKLDREFFSDTSDEHRSHQVISGVVSLAKQLHMKTVAEGVEQKEQADFLQEISCDCVQGFYFSRPIPIHEFEEKYVPVSAHAAV